MQQYPCPRCGAPVMFGVGFCSRCGTQMNWPTQQQPPQYQQPQQTGSSYQQQQIQQSTAKGRGTSGWAIFGIILLAIGILCLVAVPVIFLASSGNVGGSLIVKAVIAGILNISIGLSLMRGN